MPSKQVSRSVVLGILKFHGGKIPIDELISILRQAEYCASERALAEIGFPPRMVKEDGHWVTVIAA